MEVGEALPVDVDGVELRERGVAAAHVVGSERSAYVDPLAIALGPLRLAVGRELDRRRTTWRRGRPGQRESQSGDPDQGRGPLPRGLFS